MIKYNRETVVTRKSRKSLGWLGVCLGFVFQSKRFLRVEKEKVFLAKRSRNRDKPPKIHQLASNSLHAIMSRGQLSLGFTASKKSDWRCVTRYCRDFSGSVQRTFAGTSRVPHSPLRNSVIASFWRTRRGWKTLNCRPGYRRTFKFIETALHNFIPHSACSISLDRE